MAGRPSTFNEIVGLEPTVHDKVTQLGWCQKWLVTVNQCLHAFKEDKNARKDLFSQVKKIKDQIVRWLKGDVTQEVFNMASRCICEICCILPFFDERDAALDVIRNHIKAILARYRRNLQDSSIDCCNLVAGKLWRAKSDPEVPTLNYKVLLTAEHHLLKILKSRSDEFLFAPLFANSFWTPCQSYVDYNEAHICLSALTCQINVLYARKKREYQKVRCQVLAAVMKNIQESMPPTPSSGCLRLAAKAYLTMGMTFKFDKPLSTSYLRLAFDIAKGIQDGVTALRAERHLIKHDRDGPIIDIDFIGFSDIGPQELFDPHRKRLLEMLAFHQNKGNHLQADALARDLKHLRLE
eukprot:GILJ01004635.1.p1 GENE.GILJ01004635.1~~GILJ01004635.1.p1  ORF type:complete len:366 (-),score=30.32 GILJ01004635.1:28-1083(-)